MNTETSFPLAWPPGSPRTERHKRKHAAFRDGRERLTVAAAVDRLDGELGRLRAEHWIISTNIRPTLRGAPRSGEPEPEDVGVAIYFNFGKNRKVMPCDRWNRVADNIAAVAAHIDALRAIERYGVGTLEQAFAGYQALEYYDWRKILGVPEISDLSEIERVYRDLARKYHPDMPDGNDVMMSELNKAIAAARAELK